MSLCFSLARPSHQEVREKCAENSNHGAEKKSRGKCPGRILDPAPNERSKDLAYPEKQGNDTESCGSESPANRITHSSCDNDRDCESGETKYDGRQIGAKRLSVAREQEEGTREGKKSECRGIPSPDPVGETSPWKAAEYTQKAEQRKDPTSLCRRHTEFFGQVGDEEREVDNIREAERKVDTAKLPYLALAHHPAQRGAKRNIFRQTRLLLVGVPAVHG